MAPITIVVDDNYIPTLAKRMKALRISNADLARELGKSQQEVGRWFNSARRFGKQWTPRMSNIARIEQALINIRRRRERAAKPQSKQQKVAKA
jgi:Predicted transcriptional regulator